MVTNNHAPVHNMSEQSTINLRLIARIQPRAPHLKLINVTLYLFYCNKVLGYFVFDNNQKIKRVKITIEENNRAPL